MANRNSVWDMSTTALSNDNIAGISLQENVTKPSDVNNIMREQEAQAIRFSNDLGGAATTSGTNTITVTLAQTFAAYAVGQRFLVLLGGTNTGACTLNVNGLGAKNIKIKTSGTARDPVSGELVSGNYAEFQYDGTNMNLLSQTATVGTWTPIITSGSGTLTTTSAAGRYIRNGTLVTVFIVINITNNGTGATSIIATLPFANNATFQAVMVGEESSISGKSLKCRVVESSSALGITNYDNTYPGANGATLRITGQYESA